MMYDLLPFSIVVISLIVTIYIVVRKFPALASLDINTVQEEKEIRIKERIVSNRLKRNIVKWGTRIQKFFIPIIDLIKKLFINLYKKLISLKDKYKEDAIRAEVDVKQKINSLFLEFDDLEKDGSLDEAEKRLIEVIGLESKNIRAFKELGQLYVAKKNYVEARESFKHLIKLLEMEEESESQAIEGDVNVNINKTVIDYKTEKGSVYLHLALVNQYLENYEEAAVYIALALGVEPNNPRYLDTWVEISIIKKDKATALEAWERLAKANPENQKLEEIKDRIEEL